MYIIEKADVRGYGKKYKRIVRDNFDDIEEDYQSMTFNELCKNPWGSTLVIDEDLDEEFEGMKTIKELRIENEFNTLIFSVIWIGKKCRLNLNELDCIIPYRIM